MTGKKVLSEYLTTADTDQIIREFCKIVEPNPKVAELLIKVFNALPTAELIAYAYGEGRKDEKETKREE